MKLFSLKSLDTYEPPVIPEQKKSPYSNPNAAWNNLSDTTRRRPVPTTIGGSNAYFFKLILIKYSFFYKDLKSAFDERSIFPKYILDYETKQQQLFELTNRQQQQPPNTTSTTGVHPSSQPHMRQTVDALMKFKRQSSTASTLLSDQKAQ